MKIMSFNNSHAPALRRLAESPASVAAVAVTGAVVGPVARVGGQDFALLDSVPALPSTQPPIAPVAGGYRPGAAPMQADKSQQAHELKIMVQDFVLPGIKLLWPDASQIVTGVEIVWAGKEFWDQASDERADTTKTVIAGTRLAGKMAGLYLGLQQAPQAAITTNLFAGLVIATTDKVYSARIKAAEQAG